MDGEPGDLSSARLPVSCAPPVPRPAERPPSQVLGRVYGRADLAQGKSPTRKQSRQMYYRCGESRQRAEEAGAPSSRPRPGPSGSRLDELLNLFVSEQRDRQ